LKIFQHIKSHGPTLTGATYNFSSTSHPLVWNCWSYGIKAYGFEVTFNYFTSLLNFIKIILIVTKFIWGRDGQHDFINFNFHFKESGVKNPALQEEASDLSISDRRSDACVWQLAVPTNRAVCVTWLLHNFRNGSLILWLQKLLSAQSFFFQSNLQAILRNSDPVNRHVPSRTTHKDSKLVRFQIPDLPLEETRVSDTDESANVRLEGQILIFCKQKLSSWEATSRQSVKIPYLFACPMVPVLPA
jgi:hypothetical protein